MNTSTNLETTLEPGPTKYKFDYWAERDRMHICVEAVHLDSTEKNVLGGYVVAEWWDQDALDMFECGFFQGGRKLKESVMDYLRMTGAIPKDAAMLP